MENIKQIKVNEELHDIEDTQARQDILDLTQKTNQLKEDLSAEHTSREQADTSLQQELSGKLPKSPTNWEQWTSEEQAAARERIGSSDFELIEEITLNESVSVILRDSEPNGNPYKFIMLAVNMICPIAEKTSNAAMVINGKHAAYAINISSTTKAISSKYYSMIIGKMQLSFGFGPRTDGSSVFQLLSYGMSQIVFTKEIKSFRLECVGNTFPAGTKVQVYGVRA